MIIAIDAGHGGKDPGKVGVNDALEKSTQLKEETLGKFTNGLNIPGL